MLENEIATHSSLLAWRIPWTEEPGGLQSTGVAKSRTRLSNFTSLHFTSIQSQDIGQYIQSENVSQLCDSLQPHGLYVAHEATLSMGQEYWSGFPFPSPGDLPDPGIQPRSPALEADSLLSETPEKPPV